MAWSKHTPEEEEVQTPWRSLQGGWGEQTTGRQNSPVGPRRRGVALIQAHVSKLCLLFVHLLLFLTVRQPCLQTGLRANTPAMLKKGQGHSPQAPHLTFRFKKNSLYKIALEIHSLKWIF